MPCGAGSSPLQSAEVAHPRAYVGKLATASPVHWFSRHSQGVFPNRQVSVLQACLLLGGFGAARTLLSQDVLPELSVLQAPLEKSEVLDLSLNSFSLVCLEIKLLANAGIFFWDDGSLG